MTSFKTKALLSFFMIAIPIASMATTRPECTEWKNKLYDTIIEKDPKSKNNFYKLRSGKSTKDLLTIIRAYPNTLKFDLEQKKGESLKDTLQRAYDTPSCTVIAYLEAGKALLGISKNNFPLKKEYVKIVMDKLQKQDNEDISLVDFLVFSYLIQQAVEDHALKLSDTAYFELSQIRDEASKIQISLASQSNSFDASNTEKCLRNHSKCADEFVNTLYKTFQFEEKETFRLRERLVRWIKRVNP